MRSLVLLGSGLGLIAVIACSSNANNSTTIEADTGGTPATGGTYATIGTLTTGGAVATGGSSTTGGTLTTGGAPATGGALATGGLASTGGAISTGGFVATGGSPATGGAVTATGGVPTTGGAAATGGAVTASGGATEAGGSAAATGGVTTVAGGTATTGGTATAAGGVSETGGFAAATGGALTTGGSTATGPANSVPILTGGYYQGTGLQGYCGAATDAGGSTISPTCLTPATCFTPQSGLCASGTVVKEDTAYKNWGADFGCNLNQANTGTSPPVDPADLSGKTSITIAFSANAGVALPANLRIQLNVPVAGGTGTTNYCAAITTPTSQTIPLSSLKTNCWDTTGTAFNPASMQPTHIEIVIFTDLTAAHPYDFCVKTLTIQ